MTIGRPEEPVGEETSGVAAAVVESARIVGLAERYAALEGVAPADAAADLRAHAIAAGLPLPGGRGVPEIFDWIVEHLSRRELVEDLGTQPAEVEWLVLHVPPRGTAALTIRKQQEAAGGLELRLIGTGFGNGRSERLSVEVVQPSRSSCLRLVQEVDLRVRTYALPARRGAPPIETTTDVIGVRGVRPMPSQPCPLCGRRPQDVDTFEYEPAGPAIDLSLHDSVMNQTCSYEVDTSDEREIGLSLAAVAGVPLKTGFTARTRLQLSCRVDYAFAPGARFVPFKPVGVATGLPFWAVE